MKATDIKSIYRKTENYLGSNIRVNGWIRTVRASKSFGFIEINDGTFFKGLQVVFEDNLNNFNEICKFSVGTAINVEGQLVESQGKGQKFEIKSTKIEVVGDSSPEYPLQKKRHSFEYLRTISHLRPRTNTYLAVFRVRSLLAQAIHQFFNERGFVYVHTPIITGSDCEGAGELFQVTTLDMDKLPMTDKGKVDMTRDFFGKKTSLTVSGQLEVEAFCMAFNKVYTFGPTFRAENSNTARHLSEFWMIDAEIAFADIFDDMDLAEDMMKYVIKYMLDNAPEEMEFFNRFIDKGLIDRLSGIVDSTFERITYDEAIDLLKKSKQKFQFPVEWGRELLTEQEKYLTEKVFKKPVFVINYPKEAKAFYMRMNDDNKTVAGMDLLVPKIGEIIGGSQREERYDVLVDRIKEVGLDLDDYWWYLDLRKYGGTPHAGYGLGFARAVMYLTGMENIRDAIPFARTPKSADF